MVLLVINLMEKNDNVVKLLGCVKILFRLKIFQYALSLVLIRMYLSVTAVG